MGVSRHPRQFHNCAARSIVLYLLEWTSEQGS